MARENNEDVRADNKMRYDQQASDHKFSIGDVVYYKNRSNGPKLIGLMRRCIRLYIEKQQNQKAGYFTNGVTMFYSKSEINHIRYSMIIT